MVSNGDLNAKTYLQAMPGTPPRRLPDAGAPQARSRFQEGPQADAEGEAVVGRCRRQPRDLVQAEEATHATTTMEAAVTVAVTSLSELKKYQQLALIQDLSKILGVTPAARSQREQIRLLFVVAGVLKSKGSGERK
jgi:hypothetical protein